MQGNFAMFEKLPSIVEKTEEPNQSLKISVINHLSSLEIEFQRCFCGLKEKEFVRNSFSTSLVIANIVDELKD